MTPTPTRPIDWGIPQAHRRTMGIRHGLRPGAEAWHNGYVQFYQRRGIPPPTVSSDSIEDWDGLCAWARHLDIDGNIR